jgi:hypothetical protein
MFEVKINQKLTSVLLGAHSVLPAPKKAFSQKRPFFLPPTPGLVTSLTMVQGHVVAQRSTVVHVFCSPDFAELLPRPYSAI